MWRTIKIGRIFTSVHRYFIDDGNLETGQVTEDVFLIEGIQDDLEKDRKLQLRSPEHSSYLICLARYCQELVVITEGNVSDGVRVVVQTDVGSQRDSLVLLEQLLSSDPVEVAQVGVCGVPEAAAAVCVPRDQQLVVRGRLPAPLLASTHRPLPAAPA